MWNKKENKGFTLIELIIAMAVAAILIAAVGYFLLVGSKAYESAKYEVDLQAEAQILMNQIKDSVLECNAIDNYDSTQNGFTLYYITENPSAVTESEKKMITRKESFWLDTSEKKLYYKKQTRATATEPVLTGVADYSGFTGTDKQQYFMGQYVASMDVTLTGSVASISLRLEDGDRSYELADSVKLRNRVVGKP
jgi:prepilin-type N-terminal cleavage/methylation domain-containing protein